VAGRNVHQLSLARKQQVAVIVLIGLFVWPLLLRGLVYQFDVSPWRFAGFSMYCVPKRLVNATLHQMNNAPIELEPGSTADRALTEFGGSTQTWGPHKPASTLWKTLRQEQPDKGRLLVIVRIWELDRSTSRIVQTMHRYAEPNR